MIKKHSVLLKQIPLYPTEFCVDVWICKNKETLAECWNKRYGASVDYYMGELKQNAVQRITSTTNSELKGEKIIVMNVEDFNELVIVHEINHVMFHLSAYCHLEICYDSQEWVSYMLEYLFKHCQYKKTFQAYQLNTSN